MPISDTGVLHVPRSALRKMWRCSVWQAIRVLRVLCREEFSISSARTFVEDVKHAMEWLTGHYIYTPEQVI